jgi:hypothetical protein
MRRKTMLKILAAGLIAAGAAGCDIARELGAVTIWNPEQRTLAKEQPDLGKRYQDLKDAKMGLSQWVTPPRFSKLDPEQYTALKNKLNEFEESYRKAFEETAILNEKRKQDSTNAEAGKNYDEAVANLKKIYDESTATLEQSQEEVRIGNGNRSGEPLQPARSQTFPRL